VLIRQKLMALVLGLALLFPAIASAQSLSFREIESRVNEYKNWLDRLGSQGSFLLIGGHNGNHSSVGGLLKILP
jgi:hypothetical protein